VSQLNATLANVSWPTLEQDLHAALRATPWVISAYLLALALGLPLNGWLVDRMGAAGGLLVPMTQMMMAKVAGRHMARVEPISKTRPR
jgi:MFS family permease